MLYILDDDKFDAIDTIYNCSFIYNSPDIIRYYKNEGQIDFKIENLSKTDIVCYHNSFPCDKTFITNRLLNANEVEPKFTLICFSAATEFYNLVDDKVLIKIHKDRFYNNLKGFIDSIFNLNNLLYGENNNKLELELISNKLLGSLFMYSKDALLPINKIQPNDLKRLCELTKYDYVEFISQIDGFTVEKFKNFINILIQNK
jgi:hypothetical protein